MTKDEAMKLALEAMGLIGADLVCEAAHHEKADRHGIGEPCPIQARWHHAFTALREALAEQPAQKCSYPYCGCNSKAWCKVERNEALEKMADNARELGLDYEPVQEPVAWMDRDGDLYANEPDKNWCPPHYPLYTTPPAAQPAPDLQAELEATNRQVEILSDALAESRREVAQLKAQPAPVQEPVGKVIASVPHLRSISVELLPEALVPSEDSLIYTTPPAAQRQWVGLTEEEFENIEIGCRSTPFGKIEAMQKVETKLKEKNIWPH